jgi:hypothetical protein
MLPPLGPAFSGALLAGALFASRAILVFIAPVPALAPADEAGLSGTMVAPL